VSAGEAWARRRGGPTKVLAEIGEPSRRSEAEQDGQLVSHGARSERVPTGEQSADEWLRHGDGHGGWSSLDSELSEK
jgi:hypothetical protein